MKIIMTARHLELSDEFKSFVHEKASKLDRYYNRITELDVIVQHDSGMHEVEFIARADHRNRFVAKERHADPFAAVDLVVEHIGRQLTRHKDRHRNRKHIGGIDKEAIAERLAAAEPPETTDREDQYP